MKSLFSLSSFPALALSIFILNPGNTGVPPQSWEVFAGSGWEKDGAYTGEAYHSEEKRTKAGNTHQGKECIFPQSCSAFVLPP